MELGLNLKKIHDRLEASANRDVSDLGLTFSQHHVLIYMMQEDRPLSYKELEKKFSVAQPTMAGIIYRLILKGFVVSYRSKEDRRLKMAELTEKGRQVVLASRANMKRHEEIMLQGFSQEERDLLVALLERVRINLEEQDKEETCSKHF